MQAVYFIVGFLAILFIFIYFIFFLSRRLGGNISQQTYSLIEGVIIAGIVLGIVGMFQPWAMDAYWIGFHVLLVSLLSFIAWSHITPKSERREEIAGTSVSRPQQEQQEM
jgi:hypothetical protein